jgi:hypothetical protein
MIGHLRRFGLTFAFLLGSSSVFIVGTSFPAHAATCVLGTFSITKTVSPDAGVEEGDIIKHTITVTSTSTQLQASCTLSVTVQDIIFGSEFTGSATGCDTVSAACSNPVACTYPETATPNGEVHKIVIEAQAGAAPPTGQYCDGAEVHSTDAAFLPGTSGPVCASAATATTPPSSDGGDEDEDEGRGDGGGGGGTISTPAVTAATPVGGVQTGVGGAAHKTPVVPLTIAGGLLVCAAGIFRVRRRLVNR